MTTRTIGTVIEIEDSDITVVGPEDPFPAESMMRAVRFYSNVPESPEWRDPDEPPTATLQVRGPETLETSIRPGRAIRKIEGDNYIIASATLDVHQLYELRDAVDALIDEAEGAR